LNDRALFVLAGVAGGIDAASYSGLGQIFTANMTGNTVLLGLAAGQGHWAAVGRSGVALAGFCAGLAVGGTVAPPGAGASARGVLALEAAALVALVVAWTLGAPPAPLIAVAAIAMGLQSAAVARQDTAGAATTYLTGTLTALILRAVDRRRDEARGRARELALPAAILPVYGLAALGIALAFKGLDEWALLFPLAALLFVLVPGLTPRDR
jgi:uncharacterized membrane protein YoaK (UPF0700 family)